MKRILCVDDIQTNLFILEALFESKFDEGEYEVLTAISGKEALKILECEKVDLIFLDIVMPEMNGYETAQRILADRKTHDIPIIFLTAKKDEDTVSKCYEAGGSDYISKPYNDTELFARMHFHLELVEKKEKLEEEKRFTQKILDTQANMLLISDGMDIIRINESVKKFFNIKSFIDFRSVYDCVCKSFIQKEGYFSLADVEDGRLWLEVLVNKLKHGNVLVVMQNQVTLEEQSFDIKIEQFDTKFLISLTNITSIDKELRLHMYEAFHDKLTGVYNRAKFNTILAHDIAKASELNIGFSLLMFDIDKFKVVNDTYGHLVGDNVLVTLSTIISNNIRSSDVFARWGGEEFVLILPSSSIENGVKVAESLRKKIESTHFEDAGEITCSFGVTSFIQGDNIDTLVKRADVALYKAKESGRNRVCTN